MKVAAYQSPLLALGSMEGLKLIAEQVRACESIGVEILCCPEAVLGGLADYIRQPSDIAIEVSSGRLRSVLSPISSQTVTTIVGFTESGRNGELFNSAAVFHKGEVIGVYRKLHPAINRSVYKPGTGTSIFKVNGLAFGIVICRDSTYPALVQIMASQGATVLFVPTNNGLAPAKAGVEVVEQARNTDISRARENAVLVIRADVAGHADGLVSYGSSEIVDRDGTVLQAAKQLEPDLLIADVPISSARTGKNRSNELRILVARSRDKILGWTESGHGRCHWGSYRALAGNNGAASL